MTSGRTTAPIAALLLVVQAFATTTLPLAHAQEPETAPPAVEAHHDATCVVLHDAVRCVLCQYAGSLTPPPFIRAFAARLTVGAWRPRRQASSHPHDPAQAGSQPRAPPQTLS